MRLGVVCNRETVIAYRDETVVDAARRMREHNVGALVVLEGSTRRPVGILTDRDIVVRVVAGDPEDLERLLVGDVMTLDPLVAREDINLEAALRKMELRGVRRLPVVDGDGELVGIVALDDLLEVTTENMGALVTVMANEQRRGSPMSVP